MSEIKNTVTMTFGYADTDLTRKYKLDVTADEMGSVKDRIIALNNRLKDESSPDSDLAEFFISERDSEDNTHYFKGIVAAQIDSVTERVIKLVS